MSNQQGIGVGLGGAAHNFFRYWFRRTGSATGTQAKRVIADSLAGPFSAMKNHSQSDDRVAAKRSKAANLNRPGY